MLPQSLKRWASRSMHQGQAEVDAQPSSLGEELDDFNDWRVGTYGWVNKNSKPGPYSQYIRGLSTLSLLSDFMDVGTIPSRWDPNEPGGYPEDIAARDRLIAERTRRTHVCLLEYPKDDTEIRSRIIESPEDLNSVLSSLQVDTSLKLRLFIVEDLSRELIEALGYHLKMNPSVFQDHIMDSRWDDLDDEHLAPPELRTSVLKQNWHTLRYVRARNFNTSRILEQATESLKDFNILRRLKVDDNGFEFWDQGRHVGLIQSKATLWVQRPTEVSETHSNISSAHNPPVAVLLLDPPITDGNQLWLKSRNWTQIPPVGGPLPRDSLPDEDSHFEDLIYWAKRPEVFRRLEIDNVLSPALIPTQTLLHIICNQWLTLVDYLETRLNQIERDIAFSCEFIDFHGEMAERHNKLITWHRMLPTFRKMIQDMDTLYYMALESSDDGGMRHMQSACNPKTGSKMHSRQCHCRWPEWRNPYELDISNLSDRMASLGDHVERLRNVNTIDGSVKRSLARRDISRNVIWIIWLTGIWILGPVLAHVLTITTDPASKLLPALRVWAATAIPLMVILLLGLRFYTA